jgi:hypothetical protein
MLVMSLANAILISLATGAAEEAGVDEGAEEDAAPPHPARADNTIANERITPKNRFNFFPPFFTFSVSDSGRLCPKNTRYLTVVAMARDLSVPSPLSLPLTVSGA